LAVLLGRPLVLRTEFHSDSHSALHSASFPECTRPSRPSFPPRRSTRQRCTCRQYPGTRLQCKPDTTRNSPDNTRTRIRHNRSPPSNTRRRGSTCSRKNRESRSRSTARCCRWCTRRSARRRSPGHRDTPPRWTRHRCTTPRGMRMRHRSRFGDPSPPGECATVHAAFASARLQCRRSRRGNVPRATRIRRDRRPVEERGTAMRARPGRDTSIPFVRRRAVYTPPRRMPSLPWMSIEDWKRQLELSHR